MSTEHLQKRLAILATALLFAAALALTLLAARPFATAIEPEMARSVLVVGDSVSQLLSRADRLALPFDQLIGVDNLLDEVRRDNPDISYLLVVDRHGRRLYASGLPQHEPLKQRWTGSARDSATIGPWLDTALPIMGSQGQLGTLHLGQQAATVEAQLRELLFDLVTVLIVAVLTALELMRFVMAAMVAAPSAALAEGWRAVRQGDFSRYLPSDYFGGIGRLNARYNALTESLNQRAVALRVQLGDAFEPCTSGLRFHAEGERPTLFSGAVDFVRWPFFLLIFSDSLSLSFFPLYVEGFYSPAYGISRQVALGLPISIFMFAWAMAMPWAGLWCDRLGYRRAFAIGAGITTVGLLLTAVSQTLIDLVLWRSLTAVGYGLVFVTAQTYIANHTPPERRTKGMAMFLATFFAGSLSGAAIGGILADRLGHRPTFMLSAGLSLAAALFVLRFLARRRMGAAVRKSLSWHDIKLLLAHRPFLVITVLAAIPSKVALTGFLYYTAPLYLQALGNSQSAVGRVMMAYGLAIIAFSPLVAQMADKLGRHRWFVSIGGFAAAAAMFAIYFLDGTLGVALAILLLGVAHAIGVSPQLALISDYCKDAVAEVGQATATGIFRLIERLGNVLGPIIAGALIATYDFKGAFYGIGILTLVTSTVFTLAFWWLHGNDAELAEGRP
ncbi:MFS transporter [Chitinimonas viridis]|uniref:MFS transporter n=1 Tax=Chitinimonas viridis TaxID=664880 RepID=A0ABT8B9P3_9NEIS|nr:MFS transporter [Chitinimonas viridis]MDN3578978.1 MFS transporter [Chitinimonas viridis]